MIASLVLTCSKKPIFTHHCHSEVKLAGSIGSSPHLSFISPRHEPIQRETGRGGALGFPLAGPAPTAPGGLPAEVDDQQLAPPFPLVGRPSTPRTTPGTILRVVAPWPLQDPVRRAAPPRTAPETGRPEIHLCSLKGMALFSSLLSLLPIPFLLHPVLAHLLFFLCFF